MTEVKASTGAYVTNLAGSPYDFGFQQPVSMAFDGSRLWVDNFGTNSVTEIDPSDGEWMRTVAGSSFGLDDPSALAAANGRIWVANLASNSLIQLPPG